MTIFMVSYNKLVSLVVIPMESIKCDYGWEVFVVPKADVEPLFQFPWRVPIFMRVLALVRVVMCGLL